MLPAGHAHERACRSPPIRQAFTILAGPALAGAMWLLLPASIPDPARRAAAVLTWMAIWWLTEAVPLAVTSLLPLVLWPILGVLSPRDAAAPFADRIIFLFLGGFILAIAMERWGLHRRIALRVLLLAGSRPVNLVGGIMLATALISMWVNNTSTTMMMLPIGTSLIAVMEARSGRPAPNFARCMLLGMAYAASIGGVATPIGTAPNAILFSFIEKTYGFRFGFLDWMLAVTPLVLALLLLGWLALTRFIFPIREPELRGGHDLIRRELAELGPMSRGEIAVMSVFFLTVAGWTLREPIIKVFPATETWLAAHIDDAAVAIAGAILLFLIPIDLARRQFVMDWRAASQLPWDVLLLFGGGLSLAAGIQSSGLDDVLARLFDGAHAWPAIFTVSLLIAASVFFSEITSNTAQANIFLPILATIALAAGIDPLLILVPCGLAFSWAFMMPMGTPPNAIVFGSGRITIRQMAWAGLWFNLIGISIIIIGAHTLIPWLLPSLRGIATP